MTLDYKLTITKNEANIMVCGKEQEHNYVFGWTKNRRSFRIHLFGKQDNKLWERQDRYSLQNKRVLGLKKFILKTTSKNLDTKKSHKTFYKECFIIFM